MPYYLDFKQLSLETFMRKLVTDYLPPSRLILKGDIEKRIICFKTLGIETVEELHFYLKKKSNWHKLQSFETITEEYLTILLRELNSLHPKSHKLTEFEDISEETLNILNQKGIKSTQHLYEAVEKLSDVKAASLFLGVSDDELLQLFQYSDLCRVKWVGPTFAQMLYQLEIKSVMELSGSNAEELHQRINQLNQEKKIYKGQISLRDIQIVVQVAEELFRAFR